MQNALRIADTANNRVVILTNQEMADGSFRISQETFKIANNLYDFKPSPEVKPSKFISSFAAGVLDYFEKTVLEKEVK